MVFVPSLYRPENPIDEQSPPVPIKVPGIGLAANANTDQLKNRRMYRCKINHI